MSLICPLFSSSSGNCTLVACGSQAVLIDAGTSCKKIMNALAAIDFDPGKIGAIFLTHEHSDHIGALRVLACKLGVPVFATPGTLNGAQNAGALERVTFYEMPEGGVDVGDMHVDSVPTPHDARQSCCYIVTLPDERRAAVATDMGYVTQAVETALRGCDTVLLESNHDVNMLELGPYPYVLKRRILSERGHLSNEACAELAARLAKNGTTRFILGHLSRENNTPELAYLAAKNSFDGLGLREGIDYMLTVARPDGNEKIVF